MHIKGDLPKDLILSASEVNKIFRTDHEIRIESFKDHGHYAGHYFGLYALEDNYDQPLCLLARELGYEIVILEAMIGSFQVVTEVLDTRSRDESFKNLVTVV